MPENGRTGVAGGAAARSTATGRYIAARKVRIRAPIKVSEYKLGRAVRIRAFPSAPRDIVDRYEFELAPSTKKYSLQKKGAPRRATDSSIAEGRSTSAPTAAFFASEVLSALKGILSARLGTLAAADIDIESLGTPHDVAEWLASALPASHPFDEVAGPFYDADGVARRLQTTRSEVVDRAANNRLLACPTAEGALVFPLSQFNADGSSVAGLSDVLSTMAKGTSDRWQVALWMNTPVEELDNRTPAETLHDGDARAAQELAERTAARWRH